MDGKEGEERSLAGGTFGLHAVQCTEKDKSISMTVVQDSIGLNEGASMPEQWATQLPRDIFHTSYSTLNSRRNDTAASAVVLASTADRDTRKTRDFALMVIVTKTINNCFWMKYSAEE